MLVIQEYRSFFRKDIAQINIGIYNQNGAIVPPYPRTRNYKLKTPKDVFQLCIIFNNEKMPINTVSF